MTIKEALKWSNNVLEEAKVEGPVASSDFLLRQVLGVSKSYLRAHPEKKLTLIQEKKFQRWAKRRAKHEPVWYIAGKIDFFGQDIAVNQNVLIPRPETEIILERIIEENKGLKGKNILDIGTGSGAIILTLAKNLRENNFFASDLSTSALLVARKNARNLNHRVDFRKGDLFGPWTKCKFDLVVTNLPYVPHEDMETLAFDLTHYEPRLALDGGSKGLEVYQRFFKELPRFLNSHSKVYCEIGDEQGQAVLKMAKVAFPNAKTELVADYAEHDRLVIIKT